MTALTAARPAGNPLHGIAWMLAASMAFVAMDATGKYLTSDFSTIEISWGRFGFHLLTAFLIILWDKRRLGLLRSRRPRLQLLRSAFLMGATASYFLAVRYIPLADASAIGFVSPLVLTALSVPFLGEHVGARRWAAVGFGFVAVLLIIRPGFGMAHWAMAMPLAVATFFAFYQIATRLLGPIDDWRTTLFYSGIVGFAVTSAALPLQWVPPDLRTWGLMAFMGFAGAVSHLFMIRAFTLAPASMLAPFGYTQLVWATLVGFAVFGDFPDLWTLVGAAAIILAGLYIWHRERELGRDLALRATAGEAGPTAER